MAQAQLRLPKELQELAAVEIPQQQTRPNELGENALPTRKRRAPLRKIATPTTKQPKQSNDDPIPPNGTEIPPSGTVAPQQNLNDILTEFLFFDNYFDMQISPAILPLGPARETTTSPFTSAQILFYRCLLKQQLFRTFIAHITRSLASNPSATVLSHSILFQFFIDSAHEVGLQFI